MLPFVLNAMSVGTTKWSWAKHRVGSWYGSWGSPMFPQTIVISVESYMKLYHFGMR